MLALKRYPFYIHYVTFCMFRISKFIHYLSFRFIGSWKHEGFLWSIGKLILFDFLLAMSIIKMLLCNKVFQYFLCDFWFFANSTHLTTAS